MDNIRYNNNNKILKVWRKDAFQNIFDQRNNPEMYSLAKNIEGIYLPFRQGGIS